MPTQTLPVRFDSVHIGGLGGLLGSWLSYLGPPHELYARENCSHQQIGLPDQHWAKECVAPKF